MAKQIFHDFSELGALRMKLPTSYDDIVEMAKDVKSLVRDIYDLKRFISAKNVRRSNSFPVKVVSSLSTHTLLALLSILMPLISITSLTGAVQDLFMGDCRVSTFDGMPEIVTGKVSAEDAVLEGLNAYYDQQ